MSDTTNDEPPLSADTALALLTHQQRSIANERGSFVFAISLSWGIAWLIGFLALWSVDGAPGLGLTQPVATTGFVILLALAIAVSIVQGVRGSRGIRSGGAGAFTGTVYGISWSVALVAITALGAAFSAHGMSTAVANLYFPCTYAFAIGLLYLLAGGIWRELSSVIAGACVILVAIAAAWVGTPAHFLVLAIGGGGTFLVLACWEAITTRRTRRAILEAASHRG